MRTWSILLPFFSALIILSCGISRGLLFKSKCGTAEPYSIKPVAINLEEGDLLLGSTRIWRERNQSVPYDLGATVISDDEFEKIKSHFKNQVYGDSIYAFALFFDGLISMENNFDPNDLIGYCKYTIEKGKMYQTLYTKAMGSFMLHKYFGGEAAYLEYNSLGYYAQQVFKQHENRSFILIRNVGHDRLNLRHPKNEVLKKIRASGLNKSEGKVSS